MIKEDNSGEFQGFYGTKQNAGVSAYWNISQNDVTELNLQGSIDTRARSGQNNITCKLSVKNGSNWWPSDTASTRLICLNPGLLCRISSCSYNISWSDWAKTKQMEHVPIVLNFSHWEKAIQGDTCRISISEKFYYKNSFFNFVLNKRESRHLRKLSATWSPNVTIS